MRVLPIAQILKKDLPEVGKKAFSLAELSQAKFPVPVGFVVSGQAFREFLESHDIHIAIKSELSRVNLEDLHSVDYASRVIQDLMLLHPIGEALNTEIFQQFVQITSEFVAVRSSAFSLERQLTWSGELATFLHIPATELASKIKECWASLFSTRSLFYVLEQNQDMSGVTMAVIVQRMVEARASGILYTAHPVNQDKNQMVVEAGFGLGEALDDAAIVPDTYIVQKEPLGILDKNISEQRLMIDVRRADSGTSPKEINAATAVKQKLTDDQILELAGLASRIEAFYQHPVEIEWAYDKEFFILQSRLMNLS